MRGDPIDVYDVIQVIGGLQAAAMTARAFKSERMQGRAGGFNEAIKRLRALVGMDDHQVVAWMGDHWEVVGTGAKV